MNRLSTGTVKSGPNDSNVYLRSEDEIGAMLAELGRAAYEEHGIAEGINLDPWESRSLEQQKVWCRVAIAVLLEKDKHV